MTGVLDRCGQVRGAGIVPDIEVAALDHGGELTERGLANEVQRLVPHSHVQLPRHRRVLRVSDDHDLRANAVHEPVG